MKAKLLSDCRVLVIESDRDVRDVVAECLECHGARIRTVTNVREAERALRSAAFDVLMVESDLWRMDGGWLRHRVSQLSPTSQIIVTASWVDSEADLEGTTWLPKPFSSDQLTGAIESAFHSSLEDRAPDRTRGGSDFVAT